MPNVFAFSSYDRRLLNLIPFNFLVAEKNSYSPPEKEEKSIFKR